MVEQVPAPQGQVGDTSGQTETTITSAQTETAEKTVPLAALHEERSKRQALADELEQLKTLVSQQQYSYQQPQPTYQQPTQQFYQQPQPAPADVARQQIEQLWANDPLQAVQYQVQMALANYDRINSSTEQAINSARNRYPDFNKFEAEVRGFINAVPLQDKARQGIVDAAYYMVKGKNADNLTFQAAQQASSRVAQGVAASGIPGGGAGVVQTGPQLSQDEMKVAAVMGMSAEEYQKFKRG
jgi:hypothetical protein